MRQLQLIAHGEPSDVIELNAVSEPALGPEDVLISMEAAPLNPSDLNQQVPDNESDEHTVFRHENLHGPSEVTNGSKYVRRD